jgi:electron transfer flavoprotein beta subunit
MGADKGIHVVTEARTDQEVQPLAVAKILAQLAQREKVDAVIVGKQAIDGDNAQTGPMVSGLLNWAQATMASNVSIKAGEVSTCADRAMGFIISDFMCLGRPQGITATRETDAGTEVLSVPLPAVITADLRLNEPRYPSLPNIMKARKKPLETIEASAMGVDMKPRNAITRVEEPAARKAGSFVESVDQLVDKLKNEAKVI